MAARRRERVAFALLVPSLAVPILAIALAAWRMEHADDDYLVAEVGHGLFYFAAMMTLSATLFSMSINVVLALRNHASLMQRTIPVRRVVIHFGVAFVVAAWAVEFCVARLSLEGALFGLALVTGSVASFVVLLRGRVLQRPIEDAAIGPRTTWLLFAYPFVVALVLALSVYGDVAHSDLEVVGVALLGFLGLPWSGVTVLLWLPLWLLLNASGTVGLDLIFLVLAALPAFANAVLAFLFLRSGERRTAFINDFLEARSYADSNTLGA